MTGIHEASVDYHLQATVAGTRFFHNMECIRHLQVVRTPGPSDWPLFHATSHETTLLERVRFTVTLPQNAVVFGGRMAVQLRLVPLVKGLCPGGVAAQVLETRECEVPRTAGGERQLYCTERVIGIWRWDEPDMWRKRIGDEGEEGWDGFGQMGLPRRRSGCAQDMNHNSTRIRMQIRHKVELRVALTVEDGRVFEVGH